MSEQVKRKVAILCRDPGRVSGIVAAFGASGFDVGVETSLAQLFVYCAGQRPHSILVSRSIAGAEVTAEVPKFLKRKYGVPVLVFGEDGEPPQALVEEAGDAAKVVSIDHRRNRNDKTPSPLKIKSAKVTNEFRAIFNEKVHLWGEGTKLNIYSTEVCTTEGVVYALWAEPHGDNDLERVETRRKNVEEHLLNYAIEGSAPETKSLISGGSWSEYFALAETAEMTLMGEYKGADLVASFVVADPEVVGGEPILEKIEGIGIKVKLEEWMTATALPFMVYFWFAKNQRALLVGKLGQLLDKVLFKRVTARGFEEALIREEDFARYSFTRMLHHRPDGGESAVNRNESEEIVKPKDLSRAS